jgi:ABC-type multidrug transport system ATPase subunit
VNAPVLLVRGVTRRRRGTAAAVADISLELAAGEVVALVGPPGSGKTTLLAIAAGRLAPDAGSVTVAGVGTGTLAARALLGYAPEAPVFPPALSVREVLAYFARFHVVGVARRGLVAAALERSGLAGAAERRAAALPLPLVRRLALAQAVLGHRRVLLLDETLSGVDAAGRRAMCDRVRELAASGVAVVLASSDLAAVEQIAARVLVMRDGRVVREAPTAALLRERVLEILLDAPPAAPPPGFRLTPYGLQTDLGPRSAEAALALCREHRLAVRASRVRCRTLEDAVLDAQGDGAGGAR